jgi:hypothetical protein
VAAASLRLTISILLHLLLIRVALRGDHLLQIS